ncbi:Low molecular weight protein-tyrosine-phosphatase YfkJ [Rhodobacteraceae bacterium THAF1]|uniref:low molecular weight protein-tyrosine-phosphatase n=1 Tax=Palleronia sp. THAF1 TaxID=2587842 RepID=UPI000F3E5369|nr:low molecular weight protein-tyrosine-phosphatase [Palleronia sp. THAF1]QFU09428.1 Low molecular weight protein-tyrosine-phosphatase YfkJ [Palleronia sp. THAF1]VDC21929.1 Low molecular weight protein-tyrosine-phosphatase YfkJ [Rhodobacteraceae bacterium THAF1]
MRILVVCLGNICRSPSAEAVLRAKAESRGLDWQIDSAGTGDWHIGNPPYGPMIAAAREAGYDLSDLRARQVGPDDFARFDLILVTDRQNQRDVEALRPTGNKTPVRLLAPFAGDAGQDVPDPYHTRDFDGALRLIERAADGLLDQLQ